MEPACGKAFLVVLLLSITGAPGAAQRNDRLADGDRLLTGKPDVLYAIGAAEGEDWELLSGVRQVAFDRNDNLYVLDAGNHRVLAFGTDGRFVRQIGRHGRGPGEFRQPIGLAITTDARLVVADAGRAAHVVFDLNGVHLRDLAWDRELGSPAWGDGGAAEVTLLAHPHGGVVMRTNLNITAPDAAVSGPARATSRLVWHRMDGTQTTLFEMPQPGPFPAWVSPSYVAFSAFTPPVVWGLLPGGSAVASWEAGYAIHVADRPGRIERTIGRPLTPRPVTETDREQARELRRAAMDPGDTNTPAKPGQQIAASRSMQDRIQQAIRDMTFAPVIPVIEHLYTDPLGQLWIQRPGRRVGEPGPIDLVMGDGRYIGTLVGEHLPNAVSPSGRAAHVERDANDIQRVVVSKVPENWK